MYKQKTYKEILEQIKTEIYEHKKTITSAHNINKLLIELKEKYNIIANKEFMNNLIFENNLYAKLLYERKQIYSFLSVIDKSKNNNAELTDTEIQNTQKSEIMQIYAKSRLTQIKKQIAIMKTNLDKSFFMYINFTNKINRIMQYIHKINTFGYCEIKAYNLYSSVRRNHKTNNTYRKYTFYKYLDTIRNNKIMCSLWTDNKLINKKSIHKDSITELTNKTDENIKDDMQFSMLEKQINEIFA